jgi:hypothetical protein
MLVLWLCSQYLSMAVASLWKGDCHAMLQHSTRQAYQAANWLYDLMAVRLQSICVHWKPWLNSQSTVTAVGQFWFMVIKADISVPFLAHAFVCHLGYDGKLTNLRPRLQSHRWHCRFLLLMSPIGWHCPPSWKSASCSRLCCFWT